MTLEETDKMNEALQAADQASQFVDDLSAICVSQLDRIEHLEAECNRLRKERDAAKAAKIEEVVTYTEDLFYKGRTGADGGHG